MTSSKAAPTDTYKRIVVDGVRYYGKHLIVTGNHCNDALLSVDAVADFLHRMALNIDMQPYGDPIVARFGSAIEEGISGVQLIETSAITVHTNDQARDMYLDVFSCKGFNEQDVLAYVAEIFAPQATTHQVLLRR